MNILITIPHSSTFIPKKMLSQFALSYDILNKHIDFGTEELFSLSNYPIIKATASRFVADLNRERDDIGEGQTVIITKTWADEEVLKKSLSQDEIEERLSEHYDPFYAKLDSFLSSSKKPLFVLDGHSMDSKGSSVAGDNGKGRPDICLATGKGTLSKDLLSVFENVFTGAGYKVARNDPYSGARAKIIHYCSKIKGVQALELEVNKAVYMDESALTLKPGAVKKFRETLERALAEIKNS